MALLSFIKNLISEKEGVQEYRKQLSQFLNDYKITDEEKHALNLISNQYKLTEKEIQKIQKMALSEVFKKIISDKHITEDERKSLEVLLNQFSLQTTDIEFDQNAFNKYYSLTLIENGILPTMDDKDQAINIIFKKNEILHFGAHSILRKLKRITTRVNYGGLTTSIKIMKGVRYRVGSLGVDRQSKEVLASEDNGIFYITNERIGYIGNRKQFSISFNKIYSFEIRQEGLYIFKDGKETPYIITLEDYEVPSAIVSFILNKED